MYNLEPRLTNFHGNSPETELQGVEAKEKRCRGLTPHELQLLQNLTVLEIFSFSQGFPSKLKPNSELVPLQMGTFFNLR